VDSLQRLYIVKGKHMDEKDLLKIGRKVHYDFKDYIV
jgi:hypothetical protein